MRGIASVLVLLLGTLLAGCFASKEPLFPPASGVRALGNGGNYATFEQVKGKDEPSDPLIVRPRGDGGYDFINDKGSTPVTFHPIAGGLHVAQVKLDSNQGYAYVLVRVEGPQAVVIPAECEKQDKEKMRALGVVQRNRWECWIDRLDDPAKFFAELTLSDPISKMVRQ